LVVLVPPVRRRNHHSDLGFANVVELALVVVKNGNHLATRTKYGFPPVKRLGQGARGTSYFQSEIWEGNRRRRGHPE
jgi:hypothetical protein